MARISAGTMTAVIFAILVGLAGAYAVRQYLHRPTEQLAIPERPAPPQTIYVPMASANLEGGRTLTRNDVAILSVTADVFKQRGYDLESYMRDVEQIIGRTLKTPLARGDVFLTTSFYPDGMGPGVAELLKPGYRAVTIPIQNVGAVSGFARPGTVVDILFRSEAREGLTEVTMTLLERIEVLAVGKSAIPGQAVETKSKTDNLAVTLAVSPDQAKILKVVEGRGELSLTLRNPEDVMMPVSQRTTKITLEQLLGPQFTPRVTKMDIYRGGAKESLVFEEFGVSDDQLGSLISTPIAAESVPDSKTTYVLPASDRLIPDRDAIGGGGE